MPILSDIATRVFNRLEENPASPEFWTTQEIYDIIIEGMNEAALLTGEPQQRNSPSALTLNQTFQTMPAGSLALLRVEDQNSKPVPKTSVWDLDTDASLSALGVVRYWFPFGLTAWGVYPKMTSPSPLNVTLSFLAWPVTASRPYAGSENVPYQQEFINAFEQYGAHVARLKEGGPDFDASTQLYQDFLSLMQELSSFAERKDVLRFTRAAGSLTRVTEVRVR
jgi:hypothetical protein